MSMSSDVPTRVPLPVPPSSPSLPTPLLVSKTSPLLKSLMAKPPENQFFSTQHCEFVTRPAGHSVPPACGFWVAHTKDKESWKEY